MTDIVAFSGGIDSTALALSMPEATPVFTDTLWEHQELYDHKAKFEQVTGRNVIRVTHPGWPGGLPQYIKASKFFPNHGARYCTRIFKIEAMNLWLERAKLLPVTLNIALRADEPIDDRIGNLTDMPGLTIHYPFREQGITRPDCVRICLQHNLLPRYPAYMARGGCKGCFYKRKAQVYALVHLDPASANELQNLEESVQDERSSYFYMFGNAGASIADIRRQPLMFTPEEVYAEAATDPMGEACGLFCRR